MSRKKDSASKLVQLRRDRGDQEARSAIKPASGAVLTAAVAVVLYLPMLGGEFVYDARLQILSDDFLHDPRHIIDVITLRVLALDVLDFNRPVNLLSLMLDSLIWGKNPLGYHLTSIALHGATTALVFLLCVRLLEHSELRMPSTKIGCALAGALIFAVHPINCEAVAEVSYREDLLSAFFVTLALVLATKFKPAREWRSIAIGGACVLCLFLAAGAKENAVAGPPLLIAYWLIFRRGESRRGWLLLVSAAVLVVSGFLAARFLLEPEESVIFTTRPKYVGGSLATALMVQPRIWAFYLRQIVAPQDLSADYGAYSLRNFGLGISLAVVIVVVLLQVLISLRKPTFACGVLIFWLSLLPVSNFIPIYRPMADRFLYLPMVGVAVMIAAGFYNQRIARSMPARAALSLAALAVVCAFAVSTFRREQIWRDNLTLWRDTMSKNPFSYNAALGVGYALERLGRPDEAIAAFLRAIDLSRGEEAGPHAGLAISLNAIGREAEADALYRRAVEIDPRFENPDAVIKALIWERGSREKLERLARRN